MSRVGGHTGASLGAVELAVALHYAFDTPRDRLVWDVGHQAYAHKILTGRRELLPTIKSYGGISGFLRRDESEYDTFGAGHASTSLSAALGMAIARDRKGEDHHVVALIGDASLAGGMAMEAINQAGHLKSRLIVVLNDNEMSIAPNVGAMSKYLTSIQRNPLYNRVRSKIGEGSLNLPAAWQFVKPLTSKPLKFTVTAPYMLSKTLVDHHDKDLRKLNMDLGAVLRKQIEKIDASVLQVDEANLTGHDSHGIINVPVYIDRVKAGHIVPGAPFQIVQESPATTVIDGHWGFGFHVNAKAM